MIQLNIPLFPPSVNSAYFTKMSGVKGGRPVPIRVLTNEGKKFKREFKTWVAQNHPEVLKFFSSPSGEYSILLVLYFKNLYNSGWPKEAKTRHKKIDGTNYIKVAEDALVEACGHDDSQHVTFSVMKAQAAKGVEPSIDIWAWNSEEEDGPLEAFVCSQRR